MSTVDLEMPKTKAREPLPSPSDWTFELIEQYHGGKIFVKKSTPGKGTTFRITLPIRQPASSESAPPGSEPPPGG